jgi:CheY-like chemotaxis protein
MTATVANPTVLVADDEADVRHFLRAILELEGFVVVDEARDGRDAIDRFLALDPPPIPSVVILDHRMPAVSGIEAAETILESHPEQLVVLFSAFLDDALEARARQLGVAACVSKLEAADLPNILRGLLGGERSV